MTDRTVYEYLSRFAPSRALVIICGQDRRLEYWRGQARDCPLWVLSETIISVDYIPVGDGFGTLILTRRGIRHG